MQAARVGGMRLHNAPIQLTEYSAEWPALFLREANRVRATLGDRDAGSAEFRQALADYGSQGNKLFLPFYQGLLAEIEAEGGDAGAALAEIEKLWGSAQWNIRGCGH